MGLTVFLNDTLVSTKINTLVSAFRWRYFEFWHFTFQFNCFQKNNVIQRCLRRYRGRALDDFAKKKRKVQEVFRLRHFENKAIVFAEYRLEAAGLCFAENVGFNPGLRGPTSRSLWKSFKLDPCLFPNWNAWKIERKETRQLSPSG